MLKCPRMDSQAVRQLAVVGIACLTAVYFPRASSLHAAGLRDEAVAYRQEGYERQQRSDLDGAIIAYQKAVAIDVGYPTPYNDLGVVYERQGRLDEARQSYERALMIDPNYLEAHTNLALLHERMGNPDAAIPHWAKRYALGQPGDAWTSRAGERLAALGALERFPELAGTITTRHHLIQEELSAHDRSMAEFRAASEQNDRW